MSIRCKKLSTVYIFAQNRSFIQGSGTKKASQCVSAKLLRYFFHSDLFDENIRREVLPADILFYQYFIIFTLPDEVSILSSFVPLPQR